MYKVFTSLDDLYKEIVEDKNWQGAESGLRNRYPLRFVLFENFSDFNSFVQECLNHNIFVQSIEKWMPEGVDDQLLTYSQLARRFEEYIKSLPANDFVIAPFSEVARFYDNDEFSEFYSLVQTIRLIESPEESQQEHQRIYVPIIGMEGKMGKFKNDANISIWDYRSTNESKQYKLVLTQGTTYGVQSLESKYTVCHNLREWISLWKSGAKIKNEIICTSKAIYFNAHHAQPDNAFEYVICEDAHDFLTKGLGYDFGSVTVNMEDLPYWEKLASCVDITSFDFKDFINERFNTNDICDNRVFVQTWFDNEDDFSRWLLKLYVVMMFGESTYLGHVLNNCATLGTSELFSSIATSIFEGSYDDKNINQRLVLMQEASKRGVKITELAERIINAKLSAMASNPECGYYYAIRFMTPLTLSEKSLMIKWLGEEKIQRKDIRNLYPELYQYTSEPIFQLSEDEAWINTYFSEYVKSKVANTPSESLEAILKDKNADEVSFANWHDHFKTTKTILYNREDIDVFYWIDGLGIDWVPYIRDIISQHAVDGVYLNEVHIATSQLPTITSVNKISLQELSSSPLQKIGDLDTYAHSQKKYPNYLIEELRIVHKAIDQVLSQYNGKKIAFVSDHGISYMTQFGSSLNIAGISPDHCGRCAKFEKEKAIHDSRYVILEDNKTICSLTDNSLSSKTPYGQGTHGGAIPEEVLVPVIIVSGHKNANKYSAKLIDYEISATNPVVRYIIKGLSSVDSPILIYNGVEYTMHKDSGEVFESERVNLVDTSTKIILKIGRFEQADTLVIHTGAQEDDPFAF